MIPIAAGFRLFYLVPGNADPAEIHGDLSAQGILGRRRADRGPRLPERRFRFAEIPQPLASESLEHQRLLEIAAAARLLVQTRRASQQGPRLARVSLDQMEATQLHRRIAELGAGSARGALGLPHRFLEEGHGRLVSPCADEEGPHGGGLRGAPRAIRAAPRERNVTGCTMTRL